MSVQAKGLIIGVETNTMLRQPGINSGWGNVESNKTKSGYAKLFQIYSITDAAVQLKHNRSIPLMGSLYDGGCSRKSEETGSGKDWPHCTYLFDGLRCTREYSLIRA